MISNTKAVGSRTVFDRMLHLHTVGCNGFSVSFWVFLFNWNEAQAVDCRVNVAMNVASSPAWCCEPRHDETEELNHILLYFLVSFR